MISCAVFNCENSSVSNSDPNVQYYYFPKHPVLAQQWLDATLWKEAEMDINSARVCSVHFSEDSYTSDYKILDYHGGYIKMLKHDAIPSLHLPQVELNKTLTSDLNLTSDKNIIIYTTNPEFIYTEITEPQTVDLTDCGINVQAKLIEPKYLITKKKLEQVWRDNAELRNKIELRKKVVNKLNIKFSNLKHSLNDLNDSFKRNNEMHNNLKRRTLNLSDQMALLTKVFSESQIKILMGKKKIYWSNDDMAVGYTIRHMSNKRCYMYLSKHLNIPLPALSSIKRWATLKKGEFVKEENVDDENKNVTDSD